MSKTKAQLDAEIDSELNKVSDEQIEALEDGAARAMDHVQVGLCRIALTGRFGNLSLTDSERTRLKRTSRALARAQCAKAIRAGRG